MSDPFKNIATDRKSITEDLSTIKDINIYTIRGKHDLNFSLNGNTRIRELGNVDLVNHTEDFIKRTEQVQRWLSRNVPGNFNRVTTIVRS